LNHADIQAKSEGYKRSRNTRVLLIAVSPDESGEDALDWAMSELVEDGDEVVAMRVKEMSEEERHTEEAHEELRDEAQEILTTVLKKNNEEDGRKISVIVELVVGRVQDMILKMIALYRPDCE
jgi:nucleotide-binding universal stress UspA family protein